MLEVCYDFICYLFEHLLKVDYVFDRFFALFLGSIDDLPDVLFASRHIPLLDGVYGLVQKAFGENNVVVLVLLKSAKSAYE